MCVVLAHPNAFHPRVLELGEAGTSTLAIPSTTTTAATEFAGFVGATNRTCAAHATGDSCGACSAGGSGDSGTGGADNQSHGFCGKEKVSVRVKTYDYGTGTLASHCS